MDIRFIHTIRVLFINSPMEKITIGLDLGGTKLLGVVINDQIEILDQEKILLPKPLNEPDLINLISNLYFRLKKSVKTEISTVGIAVPGPVDIPSGVVQTLPAFGWGAVALGEKLKSQLKRSVRVENDVNMTTWAEFRLGAGKGAQSLFTFYPGTGLGGGYVQNDQLITGFNGTAGEVGHMVVDIDGPQCSCGQRGCLEAIVSNSGFRRMYKEYTGEEKSFRSDDLVQAWQKKDQTVREILTYQARALGIGIANVVNITGVERIVIGGNVYHKLEEELIPVVRQAAEQHTIGRGLHDVEIRLNDLGNEAAAVGVALRAGDAILKSSDF